MPFSFFLFVKFLNLLFQKSRIIKVMIFMAALTSLMSELLSLLPLRCLFSKSHKHLRCSSHTRLFLRGLGLILPEERYLKTSSL